METSHASTGFIPAGNARLYYEMAGRGTPLVMIHAGVADSRQWNNEFAYFSQHNQVVRYDMRGYGKSEPVDGAFSHMEDLDAVISALALHPPFVLMGCSMGGGIAMDYTLARPASVRGLIMVGSAPSGLELDVPSSPKFADAEQAFEAGNLDLAAEIETQIWFDGAGRTPEQVDPAMRKLLLEMNRTALAHEVKQLGTRLPNSETPAAQRLDELDVPLLTVVGAHDTPYILAAADYMQAYIKHVSRATIQDAAHLPNMDQPREFREIVESFLRSLP